MTWRGLILVVVLSLGVATMGGNAPVSSGGSRIPAGFVLSEPVTYEVRMTTTLTVPEGNNGMDRVSVAHALPTPRFWSEGTDKIGATNVETSQGAIQELNSWVGAYHTAWQVNGKMPGGKTFSFWTKFRVFSCRRTFDPGKAQVRWEDYDRPAAKPDERVDPGVARRVNGEIAALAAKIRQTSESPAHAVLAFAKWHKEHIKYDASVSYPPGDVAATLKNGKGHCGHTAELFEQFCAASGIPFRNIVGLNLYAKDGHGGLDAIRADYTNVHTWAEVFFPGVGWVEVEPAGGERAFSIPAQCIQNNREFQNYRLTIREKGKGAGAEWSYENGKYTSAYGVSHLITFTATKMSAPAGETTAKVVKNPARNASPTTRVAAAAQR